MKVTAHYFMFTKITSGVPSLKLLFHTNGEKKVNGESEKGARKITVEGRTL